ncbi:M1 family aminopeptidase [Fulvivirgaceae bacterium BMA10]|uniref:Aminopeptidase N n=1 Tax=Splendidivirga corallicola TaxID=3051826 RepID=A0ABT8KSP9_9BACT|nr:M1 family aminopeptidase [Fulvivirgaceae bacterium BMA10]
MMSTFIQKIVGTASIGILLIIFSCQKTERSTVVEPGVSLTLAKDRASDISDIHYQLFFSIPESINDSIPAKATIRFNLRSTENPLVLDFNVTQDHLLNVQIDGNDVDYVFQNEHILIPKKSLKSGENVIDIVFIAGETSLNRYEEYLYTLFVPDRASTAFPCFDQPNLKASYSLTLEIPSSWQSTSNGVLKKIDTNNERSTYHFEKTKPISSYLFSFVAGKFQTVSETRNGRTMIMYHRETDSLKVKNNVQSIFDLHYSALLWLEEYTAIPYPFEKFEFALIPFFQYGGMEHPGAIQYKASSLFLDESATQGQLLGRASLIAHETAHMWFGNLVTMDWFNDVWLKEVFANFMAAKIVNPNFPEVDHELRFLLAHYPAAYSVDRSLGTHPIQQTLDNLKNAGTLYGSIIYQKAPIVMKHLELMIGADQMKAGLREYLKTFSYDNATWDDLIEILDSKSEDDLGYWSEAWVKSAGMPIISLERQFHENTVNAIEFRHMNENSPSKGWPQPLSISVHRGDEASNFSLLLNDQSATLSLPEPLEDPDFILPNINGVAYGYFKLDDKSLDYLLEHIQNIPEAKTRGIVWLTLWEAMLHHEIPPQRLMEVLVRSLPLESETLNIQEMLGYLSTCFWKFHDQEERLAIAGSLEDLLWKLIQENTDNRLKVSFYRTFRNIVISDDGIKKLKDLWEGSLTIEGLQLSENDYTNMAYQLALRDIDGTDDILNKQLARIQNPDRVARMQFVIPAVSNEEGVRDDFFERLKQVENRHNESWVQEAVGYLNHPLRSSSAEKYILPSLELMEEIQKTGDIFFPTRFITNTLRGHRSQEAAQTVRDFLSKRPDYPVSIKNKILQASDMLFRAAEGNDEL